MSTPAPFLDQDDVAGMREALIEWPNSTWGNEEQELGVSPFLSFYFLYDTNRTTEICELMVDIHEAFQKLTGNQYTIATHPRSNQPYPCTSKRLPDLRDVARKTKKGDYFWFDYTSEINSISSPATAAYFKKYRDYMNDREEPAERVYSHIQLYYRWSWFRENRAAWREFVQQTIDRLKPEVVYSGFAFANPLGRHAGTEVTVWERAMAPHFYGLDIERPPEMNCIGFGLRPPTWGFLLSDTTLCKLRMVRQQAKSALSHPAIHISELQHGLWIELGDEPSLYPVEDGVPELPKLLNRLIKPIRDDHVSLIGFFPSADDPNERFTAADATRWLRRFDDDADWPGTA